MVMMVHSLLLIMMIHGGDLALARSGGVMGGNSFKSSSTESSSSSSRSSSRSSYSSSSSNQSSYSSSSTSSSSSSSGRPSNSSSSSSSSSSSRPSSSSSSSSSSSRPSSSSSSSSWTSSLSSSSKPSYSSSSSSWTSSHSHSSSSRKSSRPSISSSCKQYYDDDDDENSSSSVPSQSTKQPASTSSVANTEVISNLILWCTICLVACYGISKTVSAIQRFMSRTSVIKLQVGLLLTDQSLQKDLNGIAESADTSTSHGWIDILNRTTDSLLQHYGYCVSHYSFVELKRNVEDAEEHFKQLSIDERAKFDEETLVNLNNMKEEKRIGQNPDRFIYTYMVVTILVCTRETIKLPIIKDNEDLKNVLKKLRSIHASGEIQAVNVIWTPQEENEIMSLEELNQDYAHLRPLST